MNIAKQPAVTFNPAHAASAGGCWEKAICKFDEFRRLNWLRGDGMGFVE
jgi:hypothetical protein